LTLRDVFPGWKTGGGIFTAIMALSGTPVPWAADITAASLDLQYFGNHSGKKSISPLVDSLLDYDLDPVALYSADVDILALTAKEMFMRSWTKAYEAFHLTYDPLVNYDITEDYNKSNTHTGTVTDTGSVQYGHTIHTVTGQDATGTGKLYGFNSATAIPSDENVASNDTDSMETNAGTDTTGNTQTNNLTDTEGGTVRKYGDASVRTASEVITAELKLWRTNFFNSVFEDLDTILSIQTY
jgi:hypothetical protein